MKVGIKCVTTVLLVTRYLQTAVLLTFLLMGAVTSVKISHVSNPVEPKIQFCTLCDSLAGQVINAALNIILRECVCIYIYCVYSNSVQREV